MKLCTLKSMFICNPDECPKYKSGECNKDRYALDVDSEEQD